MATWRGRMIRTDLTHGWSNCGHPDTERAARLRRTAVGGAAGGDEWDAAPAVSDHHARRGTIAGKFPIICRPFAITRLRVCPRLRGRAAGRRALDLALARPGWPSFRALSDARRRCRLADARSSPVGHR